MGKLTKLLQRIKDFFPKMFLKYFAFDEGIDVTNDLDVLYRRNIVIKNLIGLSNMLFTLIFLGLSIFRQQTGDFIITIVFFPLTFAVNRILNKLIHADVQDKTKLEVAMYVSTLYIFLSSLLVYFRLVTGQTVEIDGVSVRLFEAASYVLIFYSLVLISLYQNKKLLRNSFLALLAVITLVHFTITYAVVGQELSFGDFFRVFATTAVFGDIVLRTVMFCLFYLVVYTIVSIGEQLANERKEELKKRRQVQNDFAHIVKSLFAVVFSSSKELLNTKHAQQVKSLAHNLALHYHISEEQSLELDQYVTIHLQYDEIKDIIFDDVTFDEKTYDMLKEKTRLGSFIAKRLQLAQKADDIVRAIYEGTADEAFINNMKAIQPEINSQIILLADVYIIMRSARSFKRPTSHQDTVKLFSEQVAVFFDYQVKETFLRYNEEFEKIYNSF